MTAGDLRVEVVRTRAGWHGRIRAANGEVVWTTEVLSDPRHVDNAVQLLIDAPGVEVLPVDARDPEVFDDDPADL